MPIVVAASQTAASRIQRRRVMTRKKLRAARRGGIVSGSFREKKIKTAQFAAASSMRGELPPVFCLHDRARAGAVQPRERIRITAQIRIPKRRGQRENHPMMIWI